MGENQASIFQRIAAHRPHPRALVGAGFAALVGVVTITMALNHPIGALTRFGPGLYPLALGIIMVGLAIAMLVENDTSGETASGPSVRSVLSVLASILAFAVLVRPAGAVAATAGMVLCASLGQDRFRPVTMLVLIVVLSLLASVLFINMLKMPMRAFPWS